MTEHVRRRRQFSSLGCVLVLAAGVLLVAGCGESASAPAGPEEFETPAQREWESQIGADWEKYEEGFAAAWVETCAAVHDAIAAEYDRAYADSVLDCTAPPPSGYGGAPIEVPADPRAAGREDGVAEACFVPPEVERPVELDC